MGDGGVDVELVRVCCVGSIVVIARCWMMLLFGASATRSVR